MIQNYLNPKFLKLLSLKAKDDSLVFTWNVSGTVVKKSKVLFQKMPVTTERLRLCFFTYTVKIYQDSKQQLKHDTS